MDAHERLQGARINAQNGNYEDALREYIWFHHHALEENPALSGVRLSFALAGWVDLGRDYPQALHALEEIRDQTSDALLQGSKSWDEFHDVVSINVALGTTALTYKLYIALVESMPEFARRCAPIALPAIVEARDFKLAKQVSSAPEEEIGVHAELLNKDERRTNDHPAGDPALRRWANVRNLVRLVQLHMAVATGNSEHSEAARLKALALNAIDSPSLRAAVETEFVTPSEAP